MGAYVTRTLSSEVKKFKLFCVFADENKDRAKVEQVAVGVRYLKMREKFRNVRCTNIINAVIEELTLSWECCTGISFDGASVMSGCRGGVATLLTQVNPHLWYMHCYCH